MIRFVSAEERAAWIHFAAAGLSPFAPVTGRDSLKVTEAASRADDMLNELRKRVQRNENFGAPLEGP